ncbi:type VII secretion system (Wss) protein ESAT-6 [Ciceribacter lividus]|uniref:Type VII secretion system (Wss) protein ESAT-6 n=1 Tax=Ciceribacter lividus TaxID=1197950 RepID=A0A6I7HG98_9HYPH|nr:WXG100 family type VII secretion target [Ciceribacter lividus]RCW19805.1 type VII secretion system (Wss) protein ESAT-6 [Ciceribacter lividus]
MSQIITNPDSMRSFARDLVKCSEALKKEEDALFRDLKALGATWKDERFQHFDKLIAESSRELAAFHRSARNYADFLARKAAAGDRIVRG